MGIATVCLSVCLVLLALLQVSVEPIVQDVVNGSIRAEDVIRGQHESLSQNMVQQRKSLQRVVRVQLGSAKGQTRERVA